MFTTGDGLTKILAKSQKVTFWSQKNGFRCFFLSNYWRCSNIVDVAPVSDVIYLPIMPPFIDGRGIFEL